MLDRKMHRARVVSSVAATLISLACGTNYVYSAWAPQFADKLHFTTTESNLIGLAGNLGMYSMGVPIGLFIDNRGPRPGVIVGSLLLGMGYVPLATAYDAGSGSVGMMSVFSFMTGLGGCMAFAAAVKTSALNWPHHRGTATAFPLAAFGLSAFFFSVTGSVIFPGNTSAFLRLLAAGTFFLTFFGFFFLRVLPHTAYHALPSGLTRSNSQQLHRTSSEDGKAHRNSSRGVFNPATEPGTSTPTTYTTPEDPAPVTGGGEAGSAELPTPEGASAASQADLEAARLPPPAPNEADDVDETSSLMSKSSTSSLPGDVLVQNSVDMDRSHRIDIRGWRLLADIEFWQLFAIMGILAGIGLMTINNIGHDVNALWKRYDSTVKESFLIQRQQMHVSILSVGSFAGRLLSGVGSDFLVKGLGASRAWCLVIASLVFTVAQLSALNVTNPHFLGFVSSLSGLGYGFLFGVFPSIVAETFGIHGLSQNWGFMTLAPAVSGNIFNLIYGSVFDNHSIVDGNNERSCPSGLDCYKNAYFVTLGACGLGLLTTLWTIRHQAVKREQEDAKVIAVD
ncbi:major facilitator superfamily domain-containing protein [Cercophora newfieldiana]|uniref:Major facilitator superfamily domain-containing protein n=1 Tax=Cercophora newfieldiana TaxID=92897 RepID=A0AA39Y627_9PEZI|nr:major facilitator superfamily domain-containing protein [Cercophora newfieldiana]